LLKEGITPPKELDMGFDICLIIAVENSVSIKHRMWVVNLDFLSEKYKFWLICKYKNALNNFSIDPRMSKFSDLFLQILKIYCDYNGLKYNRLNLESSLPPGLPYKNQRKRKKEKKKDKKKEFNKKGVVDLSKNPYNREIKHTTYPSSNIKAITIKDEQDIKKEVNLVENSKNDYYGFSNQDDESHYTPSKIIKNQAKQNFKNKEIIHIDCKIEKRVNGKNFQMNTVNGINPQNEINLTISIENSDNEEIDLEIDYQLKKGEIVKVDDIDPQKENVNLQNKLRNPKSNQFQNSIKYHQNEIISLTDAKNDMKVEQTNIISAKIFNENTQKKNNKMKYKVVSNAVIELIGDLKSYKNELSIKEGI